MVSKNILAGRTHSPPFAVQRAVDDHLLQRLGVLGEPLKPVAPSLEVPELTPNQMLSLFALHCQRLCYIQGEMKRLQRMKLVICQGSRAGGGLSLRLLMSHAMLRAIVRIVCMPSASCAASPSARP